MLKSQIELARGTCTGVESRCLLNQLRDEEANLGSKLDCTNDSIKKHLAIIAALEAEILVLAAKEISPVACACQFVVDFQ